MHRDLCLRQVLQFEALVHLNANICGNDSHLRVDLSAIFVFLFRVPGRRWGGAPEKMFICIICPVRHQFPAVPSLHLERLRTRHQLSLLLFQVKLLLHCVPFMHREAGGNVILWLLLFQKQFKQGLGFLGLCLPSWLPRALFASLSVQDLSLEKAYFEFHVDLPHST